MCRTSRTRPSRSSWRDTSRTSSRPRGNSPRRTSSRRSKRPIPSPRRRIRELSSQQPWFRRRCTPRTSMSCPSCRRTCSHRTCIHRRFRPHSPSHPGRSDMTSSYCRSTAWWCTPWTPRIRRSRRSTEGSSSLDARCTPRTTKCRRPRPPCSRRRKCKTSRPRLFRRNWPGRSGTCFRPSTCQRRSSKYTHRSQSEEPPSRSWWNHSGRMRTTKCRRSAWRRIFHRTCTTPRSRRHPSNWPDRPCTSHRPSNCSRRSSRRTSSRRRRRSWNLRRNPCTSRP